MITIKRLIALSLVALGSLASLATSLLRPYTWNTVVADGAFLALAVIVFWHRALSRALRDDAARDTVRLPRKRYPSVTVVRPVRGKDVGAAENFAAALDTDYPGEVETLFVFDDDRDPGLPVAREIVAQHRLSGRAGTADVIVAGAPPQGRTGKLNAMVVGQRRASGELIAFGDSDTRPDKFVLRAVVDELLSSPDAGAAFAPILVYEKPRAAGDVLYAVMQNALYAPLAAWKSGPRRELPFIMGQLMVFRRAALAAIGGVESVEGQLVDDMAIGKRVHAAGFTNVMTHHPLHIATGGLTLRQFVPIYRRWMMFSKNGLPVSFVWPQWLQGVGFFGALAAAIASLATGHVVASLAALSVIVAQTASLLRLHRDNGGAPIPLRYAWVPAAFFILSPLVLLQNAARKKVEWRGREYNVTASAALATSPPAPVNLPRAA
jgi:ceramide glucosyltransferase